MRLRSTRRGHRRAPRTRSRRRWGRARATAALLLAGVACFGCSAEDEGGIVGAPGGSSSAAGGTGGAGGAAGQAGEGARGGTAGAAASAGAGGVGGEPGPCPSDMVLAGESCIDRFEAPNEPGVAPLAMQTALDGEQWCTERGKHLCTDLEWNRACEGPTATLYPYGDEHVEHRCNDDKLWIAPSWELLGQWPAEAAQQEAERLYQGDPSGSRVDCRSAAGAFDLTGNVAEWVVRTIPNVNNYDHVMKGCYWAGCYGGTLPNCTFVNPAHPSEFRSYEAGFRCCSTPR